MIFCAMLINILLAQTPEWVYQYVNPDFSEVPYALTMDDNNNTYVTGYTGDISGSGLGIVKINTDGQEKWIFYLDTLGVGETGRDIVYNKNKIYVAGYSQSGTGDFIVVCVDTLGQCLWLFRDTIAFEGIAICSDSQGFIYASGKVWGIMNLNIITIALDTSGFEKWRYVYDGPASSYDEAADIVADRWCNVYVGGYSTGDTTYADYTIIKLDSAGNERWVYRYEGINRDEITALAVDTFGNVYAGGSSGDDGWDFCVVSVDSGGHERWVYRLDGLAPGSNDFCHDIAVDDSGYCYAGGIIIDDSVGLFTVVKLDSAGQEMWRFTDRGPWGKGGGISDIVLDHRGNLYAGGGFKGVTGRGYISMMKLSAAGDSLWRYVYPHEPVSPHSDYTYDVTSDEAGNGYLAGGIRVSLWDQDIVVMKFAGQVSIREVHHEQVAENRRPAVICRGGIQISGFGDGELRVYDISGKSIIRQNLSGKRSDYISLPAGVYFIILDQGGETIQQKFIVVK